MESFRYRAAETDGTILVQEVEASDKESLQTDLEKRGYLVLDIRPVKRRVLMLLRGWVSGFRQKVPARALVTFNQELLELLRAGLHLIVSLDLLIHQTDHPALQAALRDVRNALTSGSSLADALGRRPDVFSPLYIATVRAGEQSGNLKELLERYIRFQSGMLDLRNRLLTSLSYPAFLFAVSLFMILFLIGYVLPTFSEMYSEFKAPLPVPTRLLLGFSQWLREWYFLLLLIGAGFAIGLRVWYRTPAGRIRMDTVMLRVPFLGPMLRRYALAQLTRTLSTVLSGGISLMPALAMTREGLMNKAVAVRLGSVMEDVRSGVSLAEAMRKIELIPAVITRMIGVGEAAGSLETMLNHAANFQEQEITIRLSRMMSMLEPILMLALGAVIGTIVIMIYLPIFSVVEAVR